MFVDIYMCVNKWREVSLMLPAEILGDRYQAYGGCMNGLLFSPLAETNYSQSTDIDVEKIISLKHHQS